MGERKWVRCSLRWISSCLSEQGHPAGRTTVGRLLEDLGFSLKGHRKEKESGSCHPNRNRQFLYINLQRTAFEAAGLPIISVDTKKKELIGSFKNGGRAWCREADVVNVHDFPSQALGRAVPYGVYDVTKRQGSVFVGSSADTPEFAVEAIRQWWDNEGRERYPHANKLLILGDGGGSNGYRCRMWKEQVQSRLSDELGLNVTMCHYPTGCSKWNPIEHRLFGAISMNWAGKVLDTFETMMDYIRGTHNESGLQVEAYRVEGEYAKGRRVTDEEMAALNVQAHVVCPAWNYTFQPRLASSQPATA